jgi:isoquinoline 1-oxidoreductase beta subunit
VTARRDFLMTTGGLALAFHLPSAPKGFAPAQESGSGDGPALQPNAFLRIAKDGAITVWATRSEMGQGVRTSMAQAIAEELGADWSRVQVQQASSAPKYGDLGITGGSQTTKTTFMACRKVGATAREVLVEAAAARWKVPARDCEAEGGQVRHKASGRAAAFGDLVEEAALLPPPKEPALRPLKGMGRSRLRLDGPDIVRGQAQFGTDLRLPGMLVASIERCPVFGGKVKSFDPAAALAVPGVKKVFEVASGVAVLASHTWAAFAGRAKLKVAWDEGPAADASSAAMAAQFAKRLETPGKTVRKEGKGAAGLEGAAKRLKATYDFPLLAHATMEPMVATADVKADRCDIYAPTQGPGWSMAEIIALTGLKAEQIEVHIPLLGGGFGRRAMADFLLDAVECSKKAGVPVKVQWTREDDLQHDFYRPATLHHLEGGLDGKGALAAWRHRIAGPSIAVSAKVPWPPESTEISGAADLPYAIPDLEVEWAQSDTPVPLGFWRAVPASFNPFASECFFDELAHAAGKDPLAWRLELLKGEGRRKVGREEVDLARLRGVLERVRDKSGWTTAKFPKGRGHGVAAHAYLDCDAYAAQVAEVAVKPDGSIQVLRVVCAIDCGYAVNPANVKAQMEGGILFGLSAALMGEITVNKGRVVQSGFHDYPLARLADMPKVEVHIIQHATFVPPGGVGEPGLPPLAPAVGNAVFHATGKRLRSLPMTPEKVRKA